MLYTATEMAQKLAVNFDARATDVFRALRHYTNVGLLQTYGEANPGTGNKRLYSGSALIRAAILLRFNTLHMSVTGIKKLMAAFDQYLKSADKHRNLLSVCDKFKTPCAVFATEDGPQRKKGLASGIYEADVSFRLFLSDLIVINLAPYLR